MVYFYPRPPRGGRHCAVPRADYGRAISIHALREEGDATTARWTASGIYFYPRPPRGGRPATNLPSTPLSDFYPRPPRGGRLEHGLAHRRAGVISIHALREEGDPQEMINQMLTSGFLSTPSARRATNLRCCSRFSFLFLSTPSARRATCIVFGIIIGSCDFYPRPPRGGRPPVNAVVFALKLDFYPRPPRGGRLRHSTMTVYLGIVFLSTPSARRATPAARLRQPERHISIHALREEGDAGRSRSASTTTRFLSTPSARRATIRSKMESLRRRISIHALREEGDRRNCGPSGPRPDFYPRPPRGGRQRYLGANGGDE